MGGMRSIALAPLNIAVKFVPFSVFNNGISFNEMQLANILVKFVPLVVLAHCLPLFGIEEVTHFTLSYDDVFVLLIVGPLILYTRLLVFPVVLLLFCVRHGPTVPKSRPLSNFFSHWYIHMCEPHEKQATYRWRVGSVLVTIPVIRSRLLIDFQ